MPSNDETPVETCVEDIRLMTEPDPDDEQLMEDSPENAASDSCCTSSSEESDSDPGDRPVPLNRSFTLQKPPNELDASKALQDLSAVLRPPRKTGRGYRDVQLSRFVRERLEAVKMFLTIFTSPQTTLQRLCLHGQNWTAASLQTATVLGKGLWFARQRRVWATTYVKTRSLPVNKCGTSNKTRARLNNQDLVNDLHLHLQSIGKYVRAMDVVHFLDWPEVQKKYGLKKMISLRTAHRWMKKIGYRWQKTPKGQFVDGHEREDVVFYHQQVFLPAWSRIEPHLCNWDKDDPNIKDTGPLPQRHHTCVWFHDESTFYANDRHTQRWVHRSETATPYTKGEGASLMIADFVSADYEWLRSADGSKEAHDIFRA